MSEFKDTTKGKSFWSRPEGTTGAIFLLGIMGLIGYVLVKYSAAILGFLTQTIGLAIGLGVLGVIIYMALDRRTRTLFSYMYQSVMRSITSVFVTIDPIGILKNYVSDLESNLRKMGKQIGNLKGQMRNLKNMVGKNNEEIENNMAIARKAKQMSNEKQMVLSSRKAARLKETNEKYIALHARLKVLYRVLTKMYSNSEILLEDTKDQVRVKEQERKAIRASHSAMKSAMSIIKGDPDKRALFDQAMEGIAEDVANKVGEMERFMELSSDFMNSIDLQNGVFEEKGLKMLEEYEKQSTLLLLGGQEQTEDTLDLDEPRATPMSRNDNDAEDYNELFD
jgi:predicted  nucleic acid-binding Zn-ribbon protein